MDNKDYILLKIENVVYRVNIKTTSTSDENEILNLSLKDEGLKEWNLDADLTHLIDLDKNWKKFEIDEIKELIQDCLKNSKYSVNFTDSAAYMKLKTNLANKEIELTLKLNLKQEKETDETPDSTISALLKRIEFLEKKKKFQVIWLPEYDSWKLSGVGYLELKMSSDVQFKVDCSFSNRGKGGLGVYFYLSCYNEDLKELTYDKKVVYKRYNDRDVLGSGGETINFNFVLRLTSGRNKITFESNDTTSQCSYHNLNVIAKII